MMLYNRKEGSLLLPSWRFNIVTTDFCRYPYSFGYYLFLLISCGTLRIRTQTPLYLNGEKLTPSVQEVSDNPLLQSQSIRKPLIAANAPVCIPEYAQTYVYDIETNAGNEYILTARNQ